MLTKYPNMLKKTWVYFGVLQFSPPQNKFRPRNYLNGRAEGTVSSLSILVPMLLLPYRDVAKALLLVRLSCFITVLFHDLE